MARQPKTRQPKVKFAKRCMTCKELVVQRVVNGVMVRHCACKR